MGTRNPVLDISRYNNALKTGNYQGSSGIWGDLGGDSDGYREWLGYPGNRGREWLRQAHLVPPGPEQADAGQPGQRSPMQDLLKGFEISRSPDLAKLFQQSADKYYASSGAPAYDFNDALKRWQPGGNTADLERLRGRFNQDFVQPADRYIGEQKGLTNQLGQQVAGAADIQRGILGNRTALDKATEDRYRSLMGESRSAADKWINTDLPMIKQSQLNAADRNLALYGARSAAGGGPGGVSGAELARIMKAYADVEVPIAQAAHAERQNLLQNYLPGMENSIYGRYAQGLANQAGVEGQIAGAEQGVTNIRKVDNNEFQQLKQRIAGMDRDQALQLLQAQGYAEGQAQAILNARTADEANSLTNAARLAQLKKDTYHLGLDYAPGAEQYLPEFAWIGMSPIPYGYPNRPGIPTPRIQPGGNPALQPQPGGNPALQPDPNIPQWIIDQRRLQGLPIPTGQPGRYVQNAPSLTPAQAARNYINTPQGREDWRLTYGSGP